jgi:toxin YoeB
VKLVFWEGAWEEYLYWQKTDPKTLERIHVLLRETSRTPFTGIGKPEPLKNALSGWWSRRIDAEHRFIYKLSDGELWILQLKHHY